MFLSPLKSLLVFALRETFSTAYPVSQFQTLKASIEYPRTRADYPSIWVDFEATQELKPIGIAPTLYNVTGEKISRFIGWRFEGYSTFTIVALSSLERDTIFDELVNVVAFGRLNSQRGIFRKTIEDNPLIATQFAWDKIGVHLPQATPGTPWGSAEILYEITMQLQTVGEFYADPVTETLVTLSKVEVSPTPQD
jgi:hypothetical protein